jgi:hypothetical protein
MKTKYIVWDEAQKEVKFISNLNVNLWDDYDSTNLKPTYMYVEQAGLPKEVHKQVLDIVYQALEALLPQFPQVRAKLKKDDKLKRHVIRIWKLGYADRLKLVKLLKKQKMDWQGIKVNIISES